MIDIASVTILNDFVERLNSVTDQDIATCARKLAKLENEDKVIGIVESRTTRAIWALAFGLSNQMAMEMVKARMAADVEVEENLNQEVAILDQLSDIARELFWAQAKSDLSHWKKGSDNIGIRQDWTIVEHKDRNALPQFLRGVIEG